MVISEHVAATLQDSVSPYTSSTSTGVEQAPLASAVGSVACLSLWAWQTTRDAPKPHDGCHVATSRFRSPANTIIVTDVAASIHGICKKIKYGRMSTNTRKAIPHRCRRRASPMYHGCFNLFSPYLEKTPTTNFPSQELAQNTSHTL